MNSTPTQSPSPGGVQIRPGSVADQLGFTNEANPAPVMTRGQAMTAAIRAALPPEAMASARRSLWWQCRKGLYPAVAGGAVWMIADGMSQADVNPWYAPLGAALVGLGGLAVSKLRAWVGKALWRQNWYGGALAAATTWTTAAVQIGPRFDTPMPTLLVVGGALVAVPWWFLNRPRTGLTYAAPVAAIESAPTPEPEPEPEGPHEHQLAWVELVGGAKGEPLVGALLIDGVPVFDHEDQPNGMAWTIDGVRKYTYEQMRGAIGRIRLTFDRDDVFSLVQLERSRTGRTGAGRVTIMERNPLRRSIMWMGPVLDKAKGRVPLAIYPDGTGWAYYTLYRPGWGTPHDIIAGATGSGKSTALRLVIAESICAGSALMLFDPHGGGSFAEAKPRVTRAFLNAREIYAGMRGVKAAHAERLKILAEVGEEQMGPDFGHPILHVVADEAAHEMVLQVPEIRDILTALVKEGRKLWIKLTAALQDPSMDAFEDARELRVQLLTGNVLAYRLGDQAATRMVNPAGLEIAPHEIPPSFDEEGDEPTSGLGYIIGPSSRREMVSRTIEVTQTAFAQYVPNAAQLDERTREAFQRGYVEGLMDWDEKHDSGKDEQEAAPAARTNTMAPVASATAKDKALNLFRERGSLKPGDISEAGVCAPSHAYRVCKALESDGHVQEIEKGTWALVS